MIVGASALLGAVVGSGLSRLADGELARRDAAGLNRFEAVGMILATALTFVGLTLRFVEPLGLRFWLPTALSFWFLAALCVLLSVIDWRTHLLPNRFVLPAIAMSGVLLAIAAIVTDSGREPIIRMVLAGLAAYAVMYLMSWTGGLGLGDVKLSVILGGFTGWLGWPVVGAALVCAFLAGGIYAAVLVLSRRAGAKTAIAFGPWLCVGTLTAILLS